MSTENNQAAQERLEAHLREIIQWHFSPETGSPFWLDWARKAGWDPRQEVKCFADLIKRFPHFQDEWLRDLQPDVWVPAKFGWREVVTYDACGCPVVRRERVCVSPGHFETIRREVVVRSGWWETVERREVVAEGHYETKGTSRALATR